MYDRPEWMTDMNAGIAYYLHLVIGFHFSIRIMLTADKATEWVYRRFSEGPTWVWESELDRRIRQGQTRRPTPAHS